MAFNCATFYRVIPLSCKNWLSRHAIYGNRTGKLEKNCPDTAAKSVYAYSLGSYSSKFLFQSASSHHSVVFLRERAGQQCDVTDVLTYDI